MSGTLGGFRDKVSGSVYHNAQTQTIQQTQNLAVEQPALSRQTQTYNTKHKGNQSRRDAVTQMPNKYLVLDESRDKVRTPGTYFTSEQLQKMKSQKTLVIQRYCRGWAARKKARQLRKHKFAREKFLKEKEDKRLQDQQRKREYEINRRMHPKRKEDFDLLHNELQAWRIQETNKIKVAVTTPEEQQKALQHLLFKETRLLQTIDRLKLNADRENKDSRIMSSLKNMSRPKMWQMSNGNKVLVHTPYTTRARELYQLYQGLTLPLLSIEERLDVLLHVKWTVKEFDCNLTREIVQLIDREADMLNRGRRNDTLSGLRQRLASLFLAFCETPQFNPEASSEDEEDEEFLYGLVDKSVVIHAPSRFMGSSQSIV